MRRARGRRIYTGLSREQVERALRTGKLSAEDLALPPGADRWMKVPIALVHTGSEVSTAATKAPTVSVSEWTPMGQEGRLLQPEEDEEDPAELDMTPMIDVTTLLLIFFLVGGVFMLHASIDLPKARTGSAEVATDIRPVGILIDLAPREPLGCTVAFEDARNDFLAIDDLGTKFKEKLSDPNARTSYRNEAVIKAHRDAPFGVVRRVMAKLSEAGASRIAVGIEQPRGESAPTADEEAMP